MAQPPGATPKDFIGLKKAFPAKPGFTGKPALPANTAGLIIFAPGRPGITPGILGMNTPGARPGLLKPPIGTKFLICGMGCIFGAIYGAPMPPNPKGLGWKNICLLTNDFGAKFVPLKLPAKAAYGKS